MAAAGVCANCLWRVDQQAVTTDWGTLTLVGVPPSARRGRDWCGGVPVAPPLVRHSAMVPCFLGRPRFLWGIPSRGTPHSHPLFCICAANSSPLPGSALLTPHFGTQPLPALSDSCLRQRHPGLILKVALGWAVLRALEPTGAEEALA